MKKFLFYGVSLTTIFLFLFSLAFAQESLPLESTLESSPQPVEYFLPYPGILPDHPLYFLKKIRDTVLLILISNPVRKVEFLTLQADKHLNMGVFLVEKDKPQLASETMETGIQFLGEGEALLFEIPAARRQEINNLKYRLEQSLEKHQEVLGDMKTNEQMQEYSDKMTILLENVDTLKQDYFNKK